jgi:solute carrier family 25 carnitine/acylcarnitine transporter 20/29
MQVAGNQMEGQGKGQGQAGVATSGGGAGSTTDRASSSAASHPKHLSLRAALREVLRENGVRGFYRGWSAAVLRAFPANAALFWGVEMSNSLLQKAGFE